MKNQSSIYEAIFGILTQHPASRECDMTLIMLMAMHEYNTSSVGLDRVLGDIKKGLFPSFSSVSRLRRKCQELNPHLKANEIKRKELEEQTRLDMLNFKEPEFDSRGQGILL